MNVMEVMDHENSGCVDIPLLGAGTTTDTTEHVDLYIT